VHVWEATAGPTGVVRRPGPAVAEPAVAALLDDYVALTDVALRSAREEPAGLFIAEGELVLRRALRAGLRLRSVLSAPARAGLVDAVLAEEGYPRPVTVLEAGEAELQALTGFHVHRGLLASVVRPEPLPAQELIAQGSRLLLCEGLNNTTNLGAIVRSAAGLGMDGLLLDPRCCDPLYRRAVRVSMGEVFALPWARSDAWAADLAAVRAAGYRLLALTPSAHAVPLHELPRPEPGERVALLLGAEGPGLSQDALAAASEQVCIAMSAGVDSLNVAAAAAVACYAFGRVPSRAAGSRSVDSGAGTSRTARSTAR
jgi:tRNA G18 (ribose-2'-O)-methylase SpoU